MIDMNFVDVPMEQQQMSISRHRNINGGTTKAKSHEQIVVESGEVNFRFRFKIISLERITKIFEEIKHQVATNNLETEPRNVTLMISTGKKGNNIHVKQTKKEKKHKKKGEK